VKSGKIMIEVIGYKHITSKIIFRPWGPEIRCTMLRDTDGYEYNEVIPIKDGKETDEELSQLVSNRLIALEVSTPIIEPVTPIIEVTKEVVEKYFKDNRYIAATKLINIVYMPYMLIKEYLDQL
jgi:hypothetical protein